MTQLLQVLLVMSAVATSRVTLLVLRKTLVEAPVPLTVLALTAMKLPWLLMFQRV